VGLGLLEFFLSKNACWLSPKNLFQDTSLIDLVQTISEKVWAFWKIPFEPSWISAES
jgi:hypothetical protein